MTMDWKKEFEERFGQRIGYLHWDDGSDANDEVESFIENLLAQQRREVLEEASNYLDELAKNEYSEKFFPAISEEERAKDGKAADVLRRMLPRYAEHLRSLANGGER